MDLLPKVSSEFSSAAYWESFFGKRKQSFEWYGNYLELCAILHRYIKTKDDVLVAGCGNSELSEQIYDAGYHKITNVDISKAVIQQMQRKNKKRSEMKWLEGDLTNLEFSENAFSVVLDKGTLDALMSDASDEANETVEKIFCEISRVLRFGGRYICISLAQDHILNALMNFFPSNDWMVRIHKVWTNDQGGHDMPVFAFVMTKFTNLPMKIFEICLEDGIKPVRLDNEKEVVDLVKTQQYYAMMRRKLALDGDTEQPINISLFSPDNINIPRYTIHVVDMKSHKLANKFGVFIVPRGREREWLFSSDEGRRQVAESAQFKRLAFVSLSRDHVYVGMNEVQKELSSKVMELAPSNLPRNYKAPFLSVGKDDLGQLHVRHRGQSSMTGSYVVEDYVGENGAWFRQLLFQNTLVQTSVRLKQIETKTTKKKKPQPSTDDHLALVVDPSYFASQYLEAMMAALTSVIDSIDTEFSVLLLGLGGGSLVLHFLHYFKRCHVTAVEIDPVMVEIAQSWFGLAQENNQNRLHLVTDDAIAYVKSQAASEKSDTEARFDVIILDVDTKDDSLSMRCPPPPFIEKNFVQNVDRILKSEGVFMININSRDEEAREDAFKRFHTVFPHQFLMKCSEEVNDVLICFKDNFTAKSTEEWRRKGESWIRTWSKTQKHLELELSDYFDETVKIS